MTVLIEVKNGNGDVIGRCDARCYDATHIKCDCICGGSNHGKGIDTAIRITRQKSETWMVDYQKQHELPDDTQYELGYAVVNQSFFDLS